MLLNRGFGTLIPDNDNFEPTEKGSYVDNTPVWMLYFSDKLTCQRDDERSIRCITGSVLLYIHPIKTLAFIRIRILLYCMCKI